MKNILVIGAGRSSTVLIKYLLDLAKKNQWFITVADAVPGNAERKLENHSHGRPTWLDVTKPNDRREIIERHDVVISLLPPHFHYLVARDCIKSKKFLITTSFVSRELFQLGNIASKSDLDFLSEMSLDPGLDNMSAKRVIDEIVALNGEIKTFHSFAGSLISDESDNNPWHYKFTWNPENLVLAGKGTAQYLESGRYKYIPYSRVFQEFTIKEIPGHGKFEAYVNRSSLIHREEYGLGRVRNVKRCTLRKRGFCTAWDALLQLGLTDDTYPIAGSESMTYSELMTAYLSPDHIGTTVKEKVANLLGIDEQSDVIKKLEWLGLFSRKRIGLKNATPVQILQKLLEEKWVLEPADRDKLIIHHEFIYSLKSEMRKRTATMSLIGDNGLDTALAKVIGLPIGIVTKYLMTGQINSTGVGVSVSPKVYLNALKELEDYGISFKEQDVEASMTVPFHS